MTTSLVLFKAWLQRSGSSLGRVEVEVERRRGRCRRSGRVMARTALTGQPRQTMCGLGAGPRGFFFQQKSPQYSASGIGWTRTTFHTLSPDALAEPNQPASPREGKEGRCADICPIRKPPPQALDATGTRAFRVGLQCAFVPSGPSLSPPLLALPWPCPWPSQARESCVLRLLACQTQPLCMREHLSMSRYARSFSAETLALACIGKVPTVVVLSRSTGHPLSVSVALCFLLLAFPHLEPARRMYLWAQKHALSRRCISNKRIGTWPSAESPSLARLNERTHARRVG